MTKTIKEKTLDTPAARARLKQRGKPYFRAIDAGLHIGYRRGKTGGHWVMRRYLGGEKYAVVTIAISDDHATADGVGILDFFQAQRRARELAAQASATPLKGPLTVSAALDTYSARLEQEGRKSLADARGRAARHIVPVLGNMLVADLTRDRIAGWLTSMAAKATGRQADQDAIRSHRASANRVLNTLRAALNQSFRDGKVASDTAWRTVKPFRDVSSPRLRYFTKDEGRRFINAAQGTFRDLEKAGLYTGCRYGELGRLCVGDFNPDSGTVFVGQSKSGKARHVVLTDEGQKFFAALVVGRPTDALMLTRADGERWGPSDHILLTTRALAAANITGASFHFLRHTAASHMVMAGVPLNVVAHNLGHADTEKHYSHLSPSYITETIRKFTPDFGLPNESNVISIGK